MLRADLDDIEDGEVDEGIVDKVVQAGLRCERTQSTTADGWALNPMQNYVPL